MYKYYHNKYNYINMLNQTGGRIKNYELINLSESKNKLNIKQYTEFGYYGKMSKINRIKNTENAKLNCHLCLLCTPCMSAVDISWYMPVQKIIQGPIS